MLQRMAAWVVSVSNHVNHGACMINFKMLFCPACFPSHRDSTSHSLPNALSNFNNKMKLSYYDHESTDMRI